MKNYQLESGAFEISAKILKSSMYFKVNNFNRNKIEFAWIP